MSNAETESLAAELAALREDAKTASREKEKHITRLEEEVEEARHSSRVEVEKEKEKLESFVTERVALALVSVKMIQTLLRHDAPVLCTVGGEGEGAGSSG